MGCYRRQRPKKLRRPSNPETYRDTKCAECGSTRSLHLHHINFDCSDGRVENLITLCETCHRWKHAINQKKIIDLLFECEAISTRGIAEHLGVKVKSVYKTVRPLLQRNDIVRFHAHNRAYYMLSEKVLFNGRS